MPQYDDAYVYQATPKQHLKLNSWESEAELKKKTVLIKKAYVKLFIKRISGQIGLIIAIFAFKLSQLSSRLKNNSRILFLFLLIKCGMTFKNKIVKIIMQNDFHLTNPIPDDVGGGIGWRKYVTPHCNCYCRGYHRNLPKTLKTRPGKTCV